MAIWLPMPLESVFELSCIGARPPRIEERRSSDEKIAVCLSICLSVIAIASAAGTASAGLVISTPGGLNPGDHFRILFVTSGTIQAVSTAIGTYDTFVNTDANGATYNGSVISWKAIGSTTSVSAINHIGTTGDAVYLADGTKVTSSDDSSGLWSGSLLSAPDEFLDGTSVGVDAIWTGSNSDGSANTHPLGNRNPTYGFSGNTNGGWTNAGVGFSGGAHRLYGISSDLVVPGATAVPEPSTALLAGLGGLAALAYSFARKRK
ncbi:MAG: PEP-CTERM sorting domain-containing protein [Schlesneria sp.]